VLNIRVSYTSGQEEKITVKQGELNVIRLHLGEVARLHLQPLQRYDIGMGGPGRGGVLRVVGGLLGVVIDARGRPLRLPSSPAQRAERFKIWLRSLSM
jgi:hypothetical protein